MQRRTEAGEDRRVSYMWKVDFNDDQYEYRYDSCSSGCESKKMVGAPKFTFGSEDIPISVAVWKRAFRVVEMWC
jgi:hypothetical protein